MSVYQAPLHLLGRDGIEKCRHLSKEVRQSRAALVPSWRKGWYHELLAFHAGDLSPDELLKKAGSSRFNLCEAYYYLAHRRLAEGDRLGAREYYRAPTKLACTFSASTFWSRAILKVMDAHPDWLPGAR